jgi:diguanylate cyclase (GGDEF)-like protein/PAS domain S-box-containing protein
MVTAGIRFLKEAKLNKIWAEDSVRGARAMWRHQMVPSRQAVRTAAPFLLWMALLTLANYLSNSLLRVEGLISFPLAGGLLLGVLLLTPRQRWPRYAVTAFPLLALTRGLAIGPVAEIVSPTTLIFTGSSILLTYAAAVVLGRDRDWIEGRSDTLRAWARFGVVVIILIPLVSAFVHAAVRTPPHGHSAVHYGFYVFTNTALTYVVLTPLILRLQPRQLIELHRSGRSLEAIVSLAGFGLFAALIFEQPTVLPLFLLLPPLIGILFRYGFVGIVASIGLLVPIAILFTGADYGPFHTMALEDVHNALLLCRVFLILTFGIVVLVAALLHERERLLHLRQADRDIYEMVARQSGDMAFVSDLDGRIIFISPVATQVLGLAEGALGDFDWRAHVHPDDMGIITDGMQRVRAGDADVAYVFRAYDVNRNLLWFENRVRLSTSNKDAPRFIVGSTREVTARILREQQLETMAAIDALTGLPNRREFNEQSRLKWRQASRLGSYLSLHVIDVDRFKDFNDVYGHAKGDDCLRKVATAIRNALKRPEDFCARYGGEEFTVLLPDTEPEDALMLGETICAAVRELGLRHEASDHGVVTVSIGCATLRPIFTDDDGSLFEAADAALYQAKRQGRNMVAASNLHKVIDIPHVIQLPTKRRR